jgi:Xaa-Pro aminopeptidase
MLIQKIYKIQNILKDMNVDGWLIYDFKGSNDIAYKILNIPSDLHITRRFYYFIPKIGDPVQIVSAVESNVLNKLNLPGKKVVYSNLSSLKYELSYILSDIKTVAMEYSPNNMIPYISKVDAGTIELIRSYGINVVSSGDIIARLVAIWTKDQYEENKMVSKNLYKIVKDAFQYIGEAISQNKIITEYDVQSFIMNKFSEFNYYTDFPPIVASNANAADPHYEISKEKSATIKKGDLVLIDLWCKANNENAVWSDITWMGFVGEEIPKKYRDIFRVLVDAREKAFELVCESFNNKKILRGYEIDNAARKIIDDAGYGKYFVHRTGHSITTELHGDGPNADNYESKDERIIMPGMSFSIEPGIYIPGDCGFRSEIDVFIDWDGNVECTGEERQFEILKL